MTWLPRHLVRGVGAVGDSKQDKQLPSDPEAHNPMAKQVKIPITK